MKIIHCADLHLDSPFKFLEDSVKKKQRKAELISAFQSMADYGSECGVSVVIIAGDLFDAGRIASGTRNLVLDIIKKHPGIDFYYLKGNHDASGFSNDADDAPANLHCFGDSWTQYKLGEGIMLYGAELNDANSGTVHSSLALDRDCFNIVTLHGQEAGSLSAGGAGLINLNALKNKGIDYLALGHVHAYKKQALDGRGVYCYPGCLEARGFDETAEHGFVVLDIDEESGSFSSTLVQSPIRNCHAVNVDISGCEKTSEALELCGKVLDQAGIPESDLVKLELTGALDISAECDEAFISSALDGRYYYLKVKNSAGVRIDYEGFRLEQSLKGEFVRTVRACQDLNEEEKAAVIKMGIDILGGRDVS